MQPVSYERRPAEATATDAENERTPSLEPNPAAAQDATPSGTDDLPMLFCPVCSKRLASLKCKLFCERCGYYMSCADYY